MAVTNQLEIEISSRSDNATKSLDGLIAKLNEVNTALNGLNVEKINQISDSLKGIKGVHLNTGGSGGGSNGGGGGNNTINTNKHIASSFNDLLSAVTRSNRGMLNFRGTMVKMAATWGTFYAAMYPAIRLFKFLGSKVQDSMDYTETFNYFKVTMNKIGHDAGDEFADSFYKQIVDLDKKMSSFKLGKNGELLETGDKSLGLDPTAIMNFQAQIGSITNSMGLLGKTSTATQKALSMLAADYSSLRNIDLEESMKKFTSGLIGQSRALYSLGIDITNMKLKEYALAHGVTKSVSAMTQGEKAQLRMLAILDQSQVAWGDQANTISSVANQYRILKQQIANLGRTLGNLFLPIVKTVLPYLNAFIIALRKMFNLLGMKLHGDNWLGSLQDGVSEGNFSNLNEEIEDTEDAINGATKAAKKFKQATMGFDELNIINPETSSGSGSGSGGGASFDLSDDIEDALSEYAKVWDDAFNKMQNKAEELANKFMSYVEANNWFGLGDWMGTSLTNNLASIPWNNVYSGAKDFGKGFAEFLNGLISPELFFQTGKTIAGALNTALYTALSFGEHFDFRNFGKSIGNGINGFFKTYDFKALATTFNTWVDGLEEAFINAVGTIEWHTVFKKLYEFLSELDVDNVVLVLSLIGIKRLIVSGIFKKKLAELLIAKLGTVSLADIPIKITSWQFILNSGFTAMFTDAIGKLLKGRDLAGNLMPKIGEKQSDYFDRLYKDRYGKTYAEMQKDQEDFAKKYEDSWNHVLDSFKQNNPWEYIKKSFDENITPIPTNFGTAMDNVRQNVGNLRDTFARDLRSIGDNISKWYQDDVSPWFTKEKWVKLGVNMAGGLCVSWTNFKKWWVTTGFYNWWHDDVIPWFEEKSWTFDGVKEGLKKSFTAGINAIKVLWNNFADWINENLTWHIDPIEVGGKQIFGGADINLAHLPKFNIPQYSIGGFPEDGLFMANHGELVGKFSNGNTAVANNEQIIEGIRSGVANAVSQTLAPYLREIANNTGDTATNTDAIAKKPVQTLTDRGIAKASIRGQRSLGLQLRTT